MTFDSDGAVATARIAASTAGHDFLGDEDKDTCGLLALAFYTLGAPDLGGGLSY